MAQHQSAIKAARQNERRRERNRKKRSRMKSAIKKVLTAPDPETAKVELNNTISILDHMAVSGQIHKNKAANLKSKLTKRVNKTK